MNKNACSTIDLSARSSAQMGIIMNKKEPIMDIKCIALDLDRTTLNAEGRLSQENRLALVQALEKGIHIIVASGRAFATLPKDIVNIPGIEYAVTGNGAAMYHIPTRKCLHRYMLEKEDIHAIMAETGEQKVTYEAFIDGTAYADKAYVENPEAYGASSQAVDYVRSTRHLVEDIREFIIDNAGKMDSMDIVVKDEVLKNEIWERVRKSTNGVYITSSITQLIEISHKDAGKHSGLRYFMQQLGLKRNQVAAFGDADNDVDMLLYAGCGIAMANASEKCLEAADFVTKHHDENGVAYGFREILCVI